MNAKYNNRKTNRQVKSMLSGFDKHFRFSSASSKLPFAAVLSRLASVAALTILPITNWVLLTRLLLPWRNPRPSRAIKRLRLTSRTMANSNIVAITKNKETRRYTPRAFRLAPDGLFACKTYQEFHVQCSVMNLIAVKIF